MVFFFVFVPCYFSNVTYEKICDSFTIICVERIQQMVLFFAFSERECPKFSAN